MDDRALLVDFFIRLPRQGPGSTEMTEKALDATGFAGRQDQHIIDIGCGTGAQTLVLGKRCASRITAIDIFPKFLERLLQRGAEVGIRDRLDVLANSMDDLPLGQGVADLIWSEGAIYNIGFEKGLSYWRQFLKDHGMMAISEIVWTTEFRPSALTAYWHREYPDIATIDENLQRVSNAGLSTIDHFVLPPSCWQHNYYERIEQVIPKFLQEHGSSNEAVALTQELKEEIAIHRAFSEYYSYAFFIVANK